MKYERSIPMAEVFKLLEMQPPIDDPKAKALKMYESGMSREKIAKELHKSQSTITDWLKNSGVEPHRGKNIRLIQRLHDEGLQTHEIMKVTGLSRSTVQNAKRQARVESAFCYQKRCTLHVTQRNAMWWDEKRTRCMELWASGLDHFEIAYQVMDVSSDKVLEWVTQTPEVASN